MVPNSCHGSKFLIEGRSRNEEQYGDIKNNGIPRYFCVQLQFKILIMIPNFSLIIQ
jgi:hypothetical protein